MAYTPAQLQAIEDAIATGARTVKYDGREITYNSLSDLIAARDLIRASLGATTTRVTIGAFER